MEDNLFKLDRTAFKIRKHGDEIEQNRAFWLSRTPAERLSAAWYLSCRAFGLDPFENPRLDRTAFSIRKRDA